MKNIYRPDIDGLRGIAVLAVVFFHSNIKPFDINLFSGGYLGVDIFFVISGYLITKIILHELAKKKKFNFLNFYERRARRILPALFFVILISIPFAYFILLPKHLLDYAKSIYAAIFFFSNFYFIASDYYDVDAILKPLLHTWSLSIEEQFYIFYPFFLVFIFKNFRKHLINIFIFIILISFISAHLLGFFDPSTNFYILTSRIWELFCGSLISIIHNSISKNNNKYSKLENFYLIVGFSLVLLSILFFDGKTLHPSFYTAIPIIGTALIIGFSNKSYLITKFLSNKILSGIGLISYSFYLWHFVFFSLAKHANVYFDKVSKKHIIIILILSIFSYYFVEKPFRNKKKISLRKLISILSFLLILLTSSSFYIIKNYNKKNNQSQILENFFQNQIPINLSIDGEECFALINFCHYKNINSEKFVFIVGDSILESLSPDLKPRLIAEGYNVVLMNNSLCHFIPEFNSVIGNRERIASNQVCNYKYQELRLKKILSKPESIVIMGGLLPFENFQHYSNKSIPFEENYKKYVKELLLKNYKIIQLIDILNYNENITELLQKKSFKYNLLDSNKNIKFDFVLNISEEDFFQKNQKRKFIFNSIDHKNYYKISNYEIFCNTKIKKKCIFNDDKDLYIHDHVHFTKKGSELVNNIIMSKFKNFN